MSSLLTEITPLSEKDCFYIVERHKSEFLFPLHRHRDYELNFIENGRGVRRVVGDSVEEIGDYELTLVAGESLVHAWEQGSCTYSDVREITIQFAPELFSPELLGKNQFSSIRKMLARAEHGLTFSLKTIMKVYSMLDILASQTERFEQFLCFLKILNELSLAEDSRVLASSAFAKVEGDVESRRINKVKQYISEHYNEEVRLEFEQTLGAQDMNAKWLDLIRNSKMLLANTISGDGQAVAEAISKLRETEYAPTFYNDEQSLRYIIKFAYIACIGQYMKVEELPSGKGIADVVYLPKHRSSLPALVIELKWNQTAGGAIEQIKERSYPAILKEYQDEIILVGINYDTKTKEHSCVIQKMI